MVHVMRIRGNIIRTVLCCFMLQHTNKPFSGPLCTTIQVNRYQKNTYLHPIFVDVIQHLSLIFSIYFGQQHPLLVQLFGPIVFAQTHCRFSLVYVLVLRSPLHNPCMLYCISWVSMF